MTAVIAAVYAASTLALSAISYGQVQFRVSEALNVLAVFCPEAAPARQQAGTNLTSICTRWPGYNIFS